VARQQQRLKVGEKRIHEIDDVAIAVGRRLQIGNDQHRADGDGIDRMGL
jgi:hypothetical protein